jgi:hypothetical protein
MPTLDTYINQLSLEIGEWFEGVAQGTSTQSLLVDALTNAGNVITSSVASAQLWKDAWIFRRDAVSPGVPGADAVRRVATYNPANGTFTPDRNWLVAPANGEIYELHAFIEPGFQGAFLVNEALKRCFLDVEFTLIPIALNTRHDVTTGQPWLVDADWIRQVGVLHMGETRDQVDPFYRVIRGEARKIGAKVYLLHPDMTFVATDTLYVRAIKPAYNATDPYPSLPGTYLGTGLTNFLDVALPPVAWVAAASLVEAWRRIGAILDAASNARVLKDAAQAALWFSAETQKNFTLPPLTFRPLRYWGPAPRGAWMGG